MTQWVIKITDHSYWNDIKSWWNLWNRGVRTIVLRASSGSTYKDSKFITYRNAAKIVGFDVLAYHVSHPLFSANANFINFRDAIYGIKLDGPPVLDCELTGGQSNEVVIQRNKDMFSLFENEYGKVINYTRKYWWDPIMGTNNSWVKKYPLWAAYYLIDLGGDKWPLINQYATLIPVDYYGESRFMWQFSEKGYFPEVSPGNMDKNVAYNKFIEVINEWKDEEEEPPQEPPPEDPIYEPPPDMIIELPIGVEMIELSEVWFKKPITLVNFTTASGRGVQTFTLNNLPLGVKGVICRLAVSGTDKRNWVAIGGATEGVARFRLDGRVHSDVSFDINIGMIPLENNNLYINYDGHDKEVTYYVELHGYGYESTNADCPDLEQKLKDLENSLTLLQQDVSQCVKNVTVTVEK